MSRLGVGVEVDSWGRERKGIEGRAQVKIVIDKDSVGSSKAFEIITILNHTINTHNTKQKNTNIKHKIYHINSESQMRLVLLPGCNSVVILGRRFLPLLRLSCLCSSGSLY